jgi:hypothetical protein
VLDRAEHEPAELKLADPVVALFVEGVAGPRGGIGEEEVEETVVVVVKEHGGL